MSLLFQNFDNKMKQVKHNALVSYALFQVIIFLIITVLVLHKYIDFKVYLLGSISVIVLPLILFISRRQYEYAIIIYALLSFIIALSFLFSLKSDGNSTTAVFMVMFLTISLLITMGLNWKYGLIAACLSIVFIFLDVIMENNQVLNFYSINEFASGYYIIMLSSYLFSILVMVMSYTFSFEKIFTEYNNQIDAKIKIEKQLIEKNISLNALNVELEENMKLLEELNTKKENALKKSEESDKLKTSFLQNISHEIRTPLNAIIGFLNLIKEQNVKNKYNLDEYINPTINAGFQLLNIISDIIELSQFDAGTVEISNYRFDLNNMIKEIYFKTKDAAGSKGVNFILDNTISDEKCIIKSDPWRISQIIGHLLSNAVKFTFEGHIKLSCSIDDDELVFIVKDTGIGIKQEQLEEIFLRFNKIDTETTNIYGGLGIGLTIAKELTLRMNGKISVKSELGFGSEFTVKLPYVEIVEGIEKKPVTIYKEYKKILIAEDDISNYKYLEIILSSYTDIKIFHAWNGKEAVEIFTKEKDIDIVIMDIKMPVMNGVEAFNDIKKINPEIPIFAVTAYALDHEKTKYLNCGFDGYFTKPVKKGEILGLLQLTSSNE